MADMLPASNTRGSGKRLWPCFVLLTIECRSRNAARFRAVHTALSRAKWAAFLVGGLVKHDQLFSSINYLKIPRSGVNTMLRNYQSRISHLKFVPRRTRPPPPALVHPYATRVQAKARRGKIKDALPSVSGSRRKKQIKR
ncbi:hypothetical protein K491DRAFT_298655 [Lophiostoma macrostomum CBS 122681]|uniref:Uncharacterized protein n=1 Tax=Lophiostoma macrostomum CBS 122681 TaxID=1314788 RepID=A0A6A6SI84_9PLEO|nr:hypothetical protein K491DRAFT_298655 [Lophiostoma macrostomum CBS 122681]